MLVTSALRVGSFPQVLNSSVGKERCMEARTIVRWQCFASRTWLSFSMPPNDVHYAQSPFFLEAICLLSAVLESTDLVSKL